MGPAEAGRVARGYHWAHEREGGGVGLGAAAVGWWQVFGLWIGFDGQIRRGRRRRGSDG